MVGEHMELTANQIRYLLVINSLDETKHVIKSVDIARILGYSRASVHKMLTALIKMNYIQKEHYCSVSLTHSGKKAAEECKKKYILIKNQLEPLIQVNDEYNLGICNLIETM